jgi:NAD(P)-dependent dehydrogenase (short-subunit alcohol dehydrogenase family)/catechol 2,3-dioxygenase-like lactoylglutathione lyase family enzyme
MSTNNTILITGASRGLGLALARTLAQQGWTLIITARGAEALEAARRELAQQTAVVAIAGDVSDPTHRADILRAAEAVGGLDAVVNNAGILGPSPQPSLLDYPLEILEEVYRANVIAPLGVLQAVRHTLRDGARIINITSDAAVQPYEGWGGYGSSKAAFEQLSAILAAENPAWKVYWVDPGDMRTQMHQDAFPGEDISDRPLPEVSVPGLMILLTENLPSGRYQARMVGKTPYQPWLNLVLRVDNFDETLSLFRDTLGMEIQEEWREVGNGVLLNAGKATIEIADATQAADVDRIEVGYPTHNRIRVALSVPDVTAAGDLFAEHGATIEGDVVDTPWGHRNQRVTTAEGVAFTLFQETGRGTQDAETTINEEARQPTP